MVTKDCTTCLSYTRMGRIICLSVLFLAPYRMSSQAAAGRTGEIVKVNVISNLIVMPGYVNDSAKLDVVLDTGASDNILMPDRASELKLNSTASSQVNGIGRGQDETMHVLSRLRLAWEMTKS
jgi:Aspartyl protease